MLASLFLLNISSGMVRRECGYLSLYSNILCYLPDVFDLFAHSKLHCMVLRCLGGLRERVLNNLFSYYVLHRAHLHPHIGHLWA